jgi:hypothetical protein
MIAGYNAGPSRVAEWNKTDAGQRALTVEEFVARIDIPSTRAYVTSILERYNKLKSIKQRTVGGFLRQDNYQPFVREITQLHVRDEIAPRLFPGSDY